MKILVVDPGVFPGVGHNATMLEALDTETRGRADVRLVAAVAQEVDPALLGLHCELLPVFRVHGYAKVQCGTDSPSALADRLTALYLEDLLALEPHTYDLLLMPTAYPFLLAALAAGIGHLPHTRIACGLLMPPRFWAGDAAALPLLENTVKHAVQRLNQHPNVFFHSERGVYPIGETTVASAALLPPAPEPTLQWMAALSANPWSTVPGGGAHAVRFGFFGEPTARKGFHHLSAAVHAGLPAGVALTVRLPAGCEALAGPMSTADGRVDARSETMSTPAFLDAMSQVDVVLVFYAPEFHREQMSGIVAEAICLGKPLLLANGCDALIDFLSTLAPGSFLCRPFGVAGLQNGLGAPPAIWRALSHSAAASAPALRALKSASRYLTVSSGGAYVPSTQDLPPPMATHNS